MKRDCVDLVNRQPYRTIAEESAETFGHHEPHVLRDRRRIACRIREGRMVCPRATERAIEARNGTRADRGSRLQRRPHVDPAAGRPRARHGVIRKGNNTFAQRHHLRIFRRPGTFDGKPVWVCSATHDIGIDFSDRDRTFIHKIDPQIDRERAKVVNDLIFTGLIRSIALVERPQIPQDATNATGDRIETDGSMAVLLFQ